jgi:hypothetical protein
MLTKNRGRNSASIAPDARLGSPVERRRKNNNKGMTPQIRAIKSCINQKADLEALPS